MEPGAIFLLLFVLVIVALFVARPFTSHWHANAQSSSKISSLLAEKERTLTALMDLDFDNGIGKIPAEEYSVQRASLIQKGSDILQQLDEIQSVRSAPVDTMIDPAEAESIVAQLSEEDLEELIAKRRSMRQQKTAGFCHKCGKPILQSDQFCPSCGQTTNVKEYKSKT
jgi:rubrerythrin